MARFTVRRSRYKSPDGHDWRDPEMPVCRHYTMGNGVIVTDVDPEYERRFREHMMRSSGYGSPIEYYLDPTYDLRRRNVPTKPR